MPKEIDRFTFNLGARNNKALRLNLAKIREKNPLAGRMSNAELIAYLADVGAKSELRRLKEEEAPAEKPN